MSTGLHIGSGALSYSGVDNTDYKLFPDESKQKEYIRMYLEERARCKGQ